MLFAHMDQLGFVVRKIEADGLIRVERLGGVPERALPAQAVLFCVGEGQRPSPASSPTRAITRRTPEEKYRVVPYPDLYIDAGFASAAEALAAGIDIGTPVVYEPQVHRACRRPHRRHLGRRPRRLRGRSSRSRARSLHMPRKRRPCISSSRCRRNSTCAAR